MSNELITEQSTDDIVQKKLDEWGVVYNPQFRPQNPKELTETIKTKKDVDKLVYKWLPSFNNEEFDYFTGLGHQHITKNIGYGGWTTDELGIVVHAVCGMEYMTAYLNKPSNLKITKPGSKPIKGYLVPPTAASVLYCLILDSEALYRTFEEWANDLGYNSDSIKDKEIYNECCSNARRLLNCFTREQIEELQELLQDY